MDCVRVEENLEPYILGALSPEETSRMERHLDSCAVCVEKLNAHADTVAGLAFAAPRHTATARVKERLFARVDAERSRPRWFGLDQPGLLAGLGRRLVANYRMGAVAVFVVALLAGGGWFNGRLNQIEAEKEALANQLLTKSDAETEMMGKLMEMSEKQLALKYMAASPDLSVKRLSATGPTPEARGMVIVSEAGSSGLLAAIGLTPLPPDKVYQVWLLKDGRVHKAGLLQVDWTGFGQALVDLFAPLHSLDGIFITIEQVGGSSDPSGESVLKGDL